MTRISGALSLLLVLFATSWGDAQRARTVPREILDRIVDDDPNPLPRYMTPGEARLPLPVPFPAGPAAPPLGSVYTPSEYDLNEGMLIRWGSYNAILTQLAVGVTTGDPEAIVYILVTGASQQASATSILTSAGADLSQVEFITYVSNTVWIRDYGPRFIFEDDSRAVVDHTYNRPRPLDDAFNDFLCLLWDEPGYDLPLTHGGGNFHLFSDGDAFMSSLILSENPGVTEQEVIDYFADYENLQLTIYEGFPTYYDSTRHIDMWMLPVADREIIIGEYPVTSGVPYTITEDAVADLTARGYTVHRTPGWRAGGTHYTYTNAVILNELVFVPEYTGYSLQNSEALATFQAAFPQHQVIPVNCSAIIGAAGAIHCIVMHVAAEIVGGCTDFVRGDANIDDGFNIGDPVFLLEYLFSTGVSLSCEDAADANDDGVLDIADALTMLVALFGDGAPLPAPSISCGADPTDDSLGCASYPACCP